MSVPTKKDRLTQAKKNEELADLLNKTYSNYSDWVVIVRFYSALQYVEHELMSHGMSAGSHEDRQNKISNCGAMDRSVYKRYRYLQDLSEKARYYCKKFDRSAVTQSESILIEIKVKLNFT
jgi:hypothetical protein